MVDLLSLVRHAQMSTHPVISAKELLKKRVEHDRKAYSAIVWDRRVTVLKIGECDNPTEM
jgi:hypothetical protein